MIDRISNYRNAAMDTTLAHEQNTTDAEARGTVDMLDELERLLQRQSEQARSGNDREMEALAEQADVLVGRMKKAGVFDGADFARRKDRIARMYRDLLLGTEMEKARAGEQLRRIRAGKKTVAAYRRNART